VFLKLEARVKTLGSDFKFFVHVLNQAVGTA
jgi:hypothetical protein